MTSTTSQVRVLHLQIRGKVQGVCYRASMLEQAQRLGVTGWVRNRRDGSVEAMACGTPAQLDQLTAWARRGPAAAIVSDLIVTPGEGQFVGFVQWPSA